jgi:hypothetical protein
MVHTVITALMVVYTLLKSSSTMIEFNSLEGTLSHWLCHNFFVGKYYAVEDMLTTDPAEKFGTITLQEHYDRIAVEGQEYDPYTTMVSGDKGAMSCMTI